MFRTMGSCSRSYIINRMQCGLRLRASRLELAYILGPEPETHDSLMQHGNPNAEPYKFEAVIIILKTSSP